MLNYKGRDHYSLPPYKVFVQIFTVCFPHASVAILNKLQNSCNYIIVWSKET
jgi:hypothetical protein